MLAGAIVRLTGQHGRYGYRLVHAFLADQGRRVSQGRVMRIWRRESGKNAIYVLFEDWEEVLRRSRMKLLDDTDADFDRIIHYTSGESRLKGPIRDERAARAAQVRHRKR